MRKFVEQQVRQGRLGPLRKRRQDRIVEPAEARVGGHAANMSIKTLTIEGRRLSPRQPFIKIATISYAAGDGITPALRLNGELGRGINIPQNVFPLQRNIGLVALAHLEAEHVLGIIQHPFDVQEPRRQHRFGVGILQNPGNRLTSGHQPRLTNRRLAVKSHRLAAAQPHGGDEGNQQPAKDARCLAGWLIVNAAWCHTRPYNRGRILKGVMATIKGIVASVYIALNTIFWCIPVYLGGGLRLLVPHHGFRRRMGALLSHVIDGWVGCNRLLMKLLNLTHINTSWNLEEPLDRRRWYLVLSNHQTWADILVLQESFLGTIPPLSFFVKRPLLWLPGLGLAMWFLDFPYVRRYSRDVLAANPELRVHDQEATRRACEHFKHRPTSVLNFLEGTRFTAEKSTAQGATYQHLLNPKVGGLANVVDALGDRLHRIVDVTIVYPGGAPTFWEFLQGACPEVRMEIADRRLPEVTGNTTATADGGARRDLRIYVDALWEAKDRRITELLAS